MRAVELSTGAFCTEFRCEQLCDDDIFGIGVNFLHFVCNSKRCSEPRTGSHKNWQFVSEPQFAIQLQFARALSEHVEGPMVIHVAVRNPPLGPGPIVECSKVLLIPPEGNPLGTFKG